MSAIAVLLLAHSALAASRPPPPPAPPRDAHPAPLRTAPPRTPPAPTGAHGSHRAGAVMSKPIAPPPATPPPAQPSQRRHHHHHPRFFGPDCAQGGVCDEGYPQPEISVDAPPVEHWDDPVDENIPGFDEPTGPLAPPPDFTPPPIDCDGGATDFQVDDGQSGPAFFRWVDRDGSVNYTDEASVPDWARASAKRTSGDPITIAPRGACQSAAPTRN